MPTTGSEDRSYRTVAEFAESRHLHPMTVYRMVAAGELEAERFGRAIRIPADAVPSRPA
jgi:excisionase family DNA binding protein